MRIPRAEGLGQAVADPVRGPQVAQGDGGVGRALAGVAGTVAGVAEDLRYNAAHEERVRLQEEKQAQREAEHARKAANQAQASQAMVGGRESLEALQQQFDEDIQTGTVDKTKAIEEFRKQSQKLIEGGTKDVPDEHRAAVTSDLTVRASRAEGKVQRSVTKRDRSDTLAGLETTVEYAQRLATTDRAKGLQYGLDTIEQLGPFAGLLPDQIAKRKQQFVEGVAYTSAYTGIMTVKDNNAALKKADAAIAKDPMLDPQKQATLLATSATYQAANTQRAEAAAATAARKEEARLGKARAEFEVFQTVADKGGRIDPEETARFIATTAGTPYQAGIKRLAEQAVETGGIAMQPLSKQREALATVDAQIAATGRTEALTKRRSQIEKVLTASEADLKKDGLQAYVERGGGPAPKLDMSSPQAIATTLAGRVQHAQLASRWAEKPVSPLFDPEADAIRETLGKLPPKQRSEAIALVSAAMPPAQAAALARQMDSKDKGLALAFASGATGTTAGRFTSELILRGQQAQKDGTSTKGEKVPGVQASKWKATIAAELAGVYPGQTLTDNTVEAALLIAHGMAAEQGGDLSERNLKTAVDLAAGGSIVEHNGRRLALPPDVEKGALETRLKTITPAEVRQRASSTVVRAGGVEIPVEDFTAKLPGAELMFAGQGRYMVIVNGRPVTGAGGKPVVIPLQ